MITVADLKVENRSEPQGIDLAKPRFSWITSSEVREVRQNSYRLRVATTIASLSTADVWDSGVVPSAESSNVGFDGRDLEPAQRYHWRLDVQTSAGDASATSTFGTGLFCDDDWANSAWIGRGPDSGKADVAGAPLLRKEFTVNAQVASARIYVAAGGYALVSLNGAPINDAILSPGFTNYDRHVQYTATDLTAQVRLGPNAFGIELGRGFYGMTNGNVWNWQRAPWHNEPALRALLRIEYVDGRVENVVTDESWKLHDGPTLFDDLYGGETYDANQVQSDFDTVDFGGLSLGPCK